MKPDLKSIEDVQTHLGLKPAEPFTLSPCRLRELLQRGRWGAFLSLVFLTSTGVPKGKPNPHDLRFSLALTCAGVWKLLHSSFCCLCRFLGMFIGLLKRKGTLPAISSL